MTKQVRQTLRRLRKNVEKNTPLIQKKLSRKSGIEPDPAVVFSAAKYFKTLNKLAEE